MGNYITQAMLEARLTEGFVAQCLGEVASSDPYVSEVTAIIGRAEATANGYLQRRFTVPVPTSGMLEEICLALAEWELFRRGQGNVPEKTRQSREDALKLLSDIAKGLADTGSSTAPSMAADAAGIETDGNDPLFDAASLEEADW